MTYNKINVIHKYLHNKIDYFKFEEIMKSIDAFFTEEYITDEYSEFKRDTASFTYTWEVFFDRVVNEIKSTDYKG